MADTTMTSITKEMVLSSCIFYSSSSKSIVFTFDVGNEGLGYDDGWIPRPQGAIGHGFAVEY
jgi:hypothetical protein